MYANEPFALNGPRGLARWAHVLTKIPARTSPSARARIITRLQPITPEQTQNLVHALEGQINKKGEYWVRVRLPILPNGSTGWVPRGALGTYNKIWTHLVIDRRLFTATLYKRGVAVFRTRVGVGKPYWPTPPGKFYVREKITGFSDLIYGPLAFGTNARCRISSSYASCRRSAHCTTVVSSPNISGAFHRASPNRLTAAACMPRPTSGSTMPT